MTKRKYTDAEVRYLGAHIPGACIVCGNGPEVIRATEMCGPCTFGEHDAEPLSLYPCFPNRKPKP